MLIFRAGDLVKLENTILSGTPPFTVTFKRFDSSVIETMTDVYTLSQIVKYTITIEDKIFSVDLWDSCKDAGGAKHTLITQEITVLEGEPTMEGTMNITVDQPQMSVELILKIKCELTATAKDETGALVAGAVVSLDGNAAGTTDANGICVIQNVSRGTHVLSGVK